MRGSAIVLCSKERESRWLCCLPGGRVQDNCSWLERNLQWEGKGPIVVVHMATNHSGRMREEVLHGEFEELGTKLNNRTSKVIITG